MFEILYNGIMSPTYQYKAKSCHQVSHPRYGPGKPYRREFEVSLQQRAYLQTLCTLDCSRKRSAIEIREFSRRKEEELLSKGKLQLCGVFMSLGMMHFERSEADVGDKSSETLSNACGD